MAILIAIAIPVFTTQLESARQVADKSYARSAMSLAEADFLLNKYNTQKFYSFEVDSNNNLKIKKSDNSTLSAAQSNSTVTPQSQLFKSKNNLAVTVNADGSVIATWEINATTP